MTKNNVDRDSDPLRPTTTRGLDTTTYDPYDPYDPLRPATTRRNVKSPMTYHDPYDPYDPQSCEATTRVIRPLYDPSTTSLRPATTRYDPTEDAFTYDLL